MTMGHLRLNYFLQVPVDVLILHRQQSTYYDRAGKHQIVIDPTTACNSLTANFNVTAPPDLSMTSILMTDQMIQRDRQTSPIFTRHQEIFRLL